MGQILHGNATTTYAVRREIQSAPEEVTDYDLSKRLNKHVDTIRKWRYRDSVEDVSSGPKTPRSTSFTEVEETRVCCVSSFHSVAIRRLFIRLARINTPSQAIESPLFVSAPRHLSPSKSRNKEREDEGIQGVSDWIFPYRHNSG